MEHTFDLRLCAGASDCKFHPIIQLTCDHLTVPGDWKQKHMIISSGHILLSDIDTIRSYTFGVTLNEDVVFKAQMFLKFRFVRWNR